MFFGFGKYDLMLTAGAVNDVNANVWNWGSVKGKYERLEKYSIAECAIESNLIKFSMFQQTGS